MQNNVMFGIAGVVIGLFVGNMLSGPDLEDLEGRITGKIEDGGTAAAEASAAAAEETTARLTALDERIAAIETAIADNAAQSGAAGEALSSKIDGAMADLSKTVTSSVEGAGASTADRLEAAFSSQLGAMGDQLSGEIGGLGDTIGSSLGSLKDSLPAPGASAGSVGMAALASAGAADSDGETTAAAPASPPEPEIEGVRPGQTELLENGQIRVFVSGIDQDEGIARVAVNGLGLVELGGYEQISVEADGKTCLLVLDAIVEGHAQISADCPE